MCQTGAADAGLKLLARAVRAHQERLQPPRLGQRGLLHGSLGHRRRCKRGKLDVAEEAFLEALAHDPGSVRAALGLQVLCERQGAFRGSRPLRRPGPPQLEEGRHRQAGRGTGFLAWPIGHGATVEFASAISRSAASYSCGVFRLRKLCKAGSTSDNSAASTTRRGHPLEKVHGPQPIFRELLVHGVGHVQTINGGERVVEAAGVRHTDSVIAEQVDKSLDEGGGAERARRRKKGRPRPPCRAGPPAPRPIPVAARDLPVRRGRSQPRPARAARPDRVPPPRRAGTRPHREGGRCAATFARWRKGATPWVAPCAGSGPHREQSRRPSAES